MRFSLTHTVLIRWVDCMAGLAGLIVLAPLIAGLALAIRMTSSGGALFLQERIGRLERPFVCYKLRTMRIGTASAGTHEISPSAVTACGRFIRRFKLDELPQLWNVVRGDMSLVGPRPGLPTQLALIEARREHDVYRVRPGITGPGQVAGVDMSEPVRLAALDATFSSQPTIAKYLWCMVLTLSGKGQGDRVREL